MRVLLVEDDERLGREIAGVLRRANYAVDLVGDGVEAGFLAETEPYDAVVLDLGLPDKDGLAVLAELRGKGIATPVLILTARDRFSDMVAGFRTGADDYLKKPFHIDELVVRLAALIRRGHGTPQGMLTCGSLSLDTTSGTVLLDNMPLAMTALEARVLRYLIQRKNTVVSRMQLAEHVYERDVDRGFNSLEVIVSRLRRKIGSNRITTVRGEGYRLEA